jgi:hypothetical protein
MKLFSITLIFLTCLTVPAVVAQEDPVNPVHPQNGKEIIKLLDSLYFYIWKDELDIWENSDLDLFYYDNNTRLVKWVRKDWDENLIRYEWFDEFRVTYQYEEGILSGELKENWVLGTNQWVNYSRYSYSYDEEGNKTEWKWERWDEGMSDWTNFRLTLYGYDTNGNLITFTTQMWEPTVSGWINSQDIRYHYDQNGNDTMTLTLVWNLDSLNWENLNKKLNQYNLSGQQVRVLYQDWNPDLKAWIDYRLTVYTYDGSGFLTESLSQDWDPTTQNWKNKSKLVYSNNVQGQPMNYTEYKWDPTLLDWLNRSGGFYEYDTEGDRINSVTQIWGENEEWLNSTRLRYVYIKVISVPELVTTWIECRTGSKGSGILCVECTGLQPDKTYTLTLFDLGGGQSFSQAFRGDTSRLINSALSAGIYLLVIHDGQQICFRDKVYIAR